MVTKKKRIIIISSIIGVILVAVAITLVLIKVSRWEVISGIKVEYGNKISTDVADYLPKNTDAKIIQNATVEIVELSEYPPVGDYVVKVKYKNQVKEVIVSIIDTTKPAFVNFNKEVNIYTGEQVENWNTLFSAEDLSKVTISVDDSAVNYSVAGTYPIKVIATDTSKNSVSETANLNIIQSSLSINTGSVTLKKGNTYQLQPTVVGRDSNIKYTSSNNSVATVDENGKITGIGKGTATITVEANGLSATCEVSVTVASRPTSNKNNNNNSNNNNSSSDNDGSGATSGWGDAPGWEDTSDETDWDKKGDIDLDINVP